MGPKKNNKKHQMLDENANHIGDTNLNTINSEGSKRLKTDHEAFNGDPNEYTKESIKKQKIFTYDAQQLYECFLFHGIPSKVCDLFLENDVNGAEFKEWPCDDIESFSEFIQKYFEKLNKKAKSYKIVDLKNEKSFKNLIKHLFAIAKSYKRNPYPKRNKIICDCVHGQISVHPLLIKIIDTPQFQRLRYLKQLGIIYYIYPSANHTRFEHCIGTSHLAGLLIKHLKESQPSLGITNADELCVKIAGLCHDLGHGPFSHLFEEVIEKFDTSHSKDSWKHEMATLKLFDKMMDENPDLCDEFECYGLFKNDRDFIKDLIYHPSFKKSNNDPATIDKILKNLDSLKDRGLDKSFLFEIVSNVRTGIDVDKFDYFQRDCTFLGCKNDFDHNRYIYCTRVIKRDDEGLNQICVRDKAVNDLYQLYHVRHTLTKRAYKHDTGSSINLMVVEALEKADKFFKFSTIFTGKDALDRYEKLNDDIFLQILYSTDPSLKQSREILQRIVKRNLYKHVSTLILPLSEKEYDKKELEAEFKDYIAEKKKKDDRYIVQLEDVALEIIRLNYGSRNKNPVENVRYYSKYNLNVSFPIHKDEVSNMLLEKFEDNQLRVYSKNSNFDYVSELSEHFKKWCEKKGYKNKPLFGTSNDY